MTASLDWFEMLSAAGHKNANRREILWRIRHSLMRSVPDDFLSLEVRLLGYDQQPISAAWAPQYVVYLVERERGDVRRVQSEHLIFEGSPDTAKLILAAFGEATREQDMRMVVLYWREGFILLRQWGSAQDTGCETRGHAIFTGVVSARQRHQVGEVRSSRRCLCGAMQEPDPTHPEPLPHCLFLDQFIVSRA